MDFVELPEHLSCSFTGTNSPVILRIEGNAKDCGFRVEEYEDKPPHITIIGDTASARLLFVRTIDDLFQYLDVVERHQFIRSDEIYRMAPGWFLLDQRQPDSRIFLFATGDQYEFRACGDWDEIDLRDACKRLKAIYERFYDTVI